jgi:predicted MPP superfamily phosphohydrolase
MGTVELQIDAGNRDVAPSDADFVLAHLSDLHLSSLDGVSPRALLDKRMLGYASWWLRRRYEHRTDVLDVLRADLQAEHLDHIAVTGDLTHLGLPQEFREAAAWLARLGRPEGITVIPGNHDAYVPESWRETFALVACMRDDAGRARRRRVSSLRLRRHAALIGHRRRGLRRRSRPRA